MSKTIRATCEANVVTAESTVIPTARVASAGLGPSEGVLIIDEDRVDYLTSNASDLDESLEQMISALSNAGAGLTAASSALSTLAGALGLSLAIAPNLASISAATSIISDAANELQAIQERLK